eukprot:TRINITY_DN12114_c0_g1_i3.p1 TRINITY_DN12114_c0_g1~~TRINITY_DN12114_c0_g1_i3.p1  ORF type:complete len:367 (+),score=73.84 TRINITY_DN12114_c0_g1_i3:441-1541(+)
MYYSDQITPQDLENILARLTVDPQLAGHQQPHSPTLRWFGREGIAVLRPIKDSVRIRRNVKVILSNEEHKRVSNTRKKTTSVHLVCLNEKLLPAQWPETMIIRIESRQIQIPHGSWRERDESRSWYRTTCPIDISGYVSPFTKTVYATMEAQDLKQGVIIAACLVENIGVPEVIEATKKRLLNQVAVHTSTPPANQQSDVTFDKAVVSVLDPVTLHRVSIPARTPSCTHHNRFDLETFINFCSSSRVWACPECDEPAPLTALEYDPTFDAILQHPSVKNDSSVSQIVLHADGRWEAKQDVKLPRTAARKRPLPDIVLLEDEEEEILPGLSRGFEEDDEDDGSSESTECCPAAKKRMVGTMDDPIEL